jgi:hypothetical protein
MLHELGTDISQSSACGESPVFAAAGIGQFECIKVLHKLGANIHMCTKVDESPVFVAAKYYGNEECIRLMHELGADVQPLVNYWNYDNDVSPDIAQITNDVRSFLATTALNPSPHQYTLYSLAQLAVYYLQRHTSNQKQDMVNSFALQLAVVMQDSLIVAPFEAAAAAATTTPA